MNKNNDDNFIAHKGKKYIKDKHGYFTIPNKGIHYNTNIIEIRKNNKVIATLIGIETVKIFININNICTYAEYRSILDKEIKTKPNETYPKGGFTFKTINKEKYMKDNNLEFKAIRR